MNNENIELRGGICGRVTGNYESHWSGLIQHNYSL